MRLGRAGRVGVGLVVVAAALGLALGASAAFGDDDGSGTVLGPGAVTVELTVHHSRFSPEVIRVRAGTTVRFEVVNDDPIDHELIVGPQEVHDRHEGGNEAAHPPVPGEVSVPPLTTAGTVYNFGDPGPVLFACHLPGHFAYGMRGTILVEA